MFYIVKNSLVTSSFLSLTLSRFGVSVNQKGCAFARLCLRGFMESLVGVSVKIDFSFFFSSSSGSATSQRPLVRGLWVFPFVVVVV